METELRTARFRDAAIKAVDGHTTLLDLAKSLVCDGHDYSRIDYHVHSTYNFSMTNIVLSKQYVGDNEGCGRHTVCLNGVNVMYRERDLFPENFTTTALQRVFDKLQLSNTTLDDFTRFLCTIFDTIP